MKILINYADEEFRFIRDFNSLAGRKIGGFDKVIEYSPEDLDPEFRRKNQHILRHQRGGGYWLWKPYIICKTLEQMGEDDFLLYADAGSLFVAPIDSFIQLMNETNQDIIPFLTPCEEHLEKIWTKRDAFVLMGCDEPRYANTRQISAGFSLWRKTTFSLKFIAEWLQYAQDERIITDLPNRCGKPNYPGFRENRHDQTILSLLAKKHDLRPYENPERSTPDLKYPKLVLSVRRSASIPRTLIRSVILHHMFIPSTRRLNALLLRKITLSRHIGTLVTVAYQAVARRCTKVLARARKGASSLPPS